MAENKEEFKLYTTMDATVWAEEFLKCVVFEKHPIDLDTMRAWFANSIMCGYDHHGYKTQKQIDSLNAKLKIAEKALENITTMKWSENNTNAGPEDATPKEKGLFMYVGSIWDISRAALTKIREGIEHEKKKE